MGEEPSEDELPRPMHYVFAHRLLAGAILTRPARFLDVAHGPDAEQQLRRTWERMAARMPGPDGVPLSPEGLRSTVVERSTYSVVLVTMPRPERVPEAHFVAGVIGPIRRWWIFRLKEPWSQVFTLELAAPDEDGSPTTVLGGWTRSRTHRNLGPGPPPDPEQFLQVIEKPIERERA